MIKIRLADATPRQLDWLVASVFGVSLPLNNDGFCIMYATWKALPEALCCDMDKPDLQVYSPTMSWAQCGAILDMMDIEIRRWGTGEYAWRATPVHMQWAYGATQKEAVCRAFLLSKLGKDVLVPEGLP